MKNKKGQVTIFIIIAMVIVTGVALFFITKSNLFTPQVPSNVQSAYLNFLSCLEEDTLVGIDVLESQAGYIQIPNYEIGTPSIPFSSQLDFVGSSIPYWYYVSGGNIPKEQIPSKTEMETELKNFIEEKIRQCNFQSYYEEGFEINQDDAEANVQINNNDVVVDMYMNLEIKKGEEVTLIKNHKIAVSSKLGTLYNSARVLYEKEKKEMFLENYGVDILRLYAPVDGVELTCGPKIWNTYDIFSSLQDAIEVNTFALSTQNPSTESEKYFFVEASIPTKARFITSKNWPMSFEVLPSEGNVLTAKPIGNQQGLGAAGLCFVPYHFVYDFNYPILIQVYEGEEVFQFPVAIVIRGNKPRTALNYTASKGVELELCPYKNVLTNIEVVDSNSNPINAEISYECLGENCYIGKASSGILEEQFPQCVNGFISAEANGFANTRYQYSTTTEGNAQIVMNKLYDQDIKLKIDGANYQGEALIYFNSEENSQTISYPLQKKVNLSQGDYEISVYIYKNSSINLPETTTKECTKLPSSGILGIFGATQESCVDMKIPAQVISNALTAGGTANLYLEGSSLKNSNSIEIDTTNFGTPSSIEQLQNNYLIFETSKLVVNLN